MKRCSVLGFRNRIQACRCDAVIFVFCKNGRVYLKVGRTQQGCQIFRVFLRNDQQEGDLESSTTIKSLNSRTETKTRNKKAFNAFTAKLAPLPVLVLEQDALIWRAQVGLKGFRSIGWSRRANGALSPFQPRERVWRCLFAFVLTQQR